MLRLNTREHFGLFGEQTLERPPAVESEHNSQGHPIIHRFTFSLHPKEKTF